MPGLGRGTEQVGKENEKLQQELETENADLEIEKERKKAAQALAVTPQKHQTSHLREKSRLASQLSKLEKQSKRAREEGIKQHAAREQMHEKEAAKRQKQTEDATMQLNKEKTGLAERALNAE